MLHRRYPERHRGKRRNETLEDEHKFAVQEDQLYYRTGKHNSSSLAYSLDQKEEQK